MARYSQDHKQQTHARILKAARPLLQTEGIDGIGIPAVMEQAGLTHGGFYAHFHSKDSLVAEVCAGALARRVEKLAAAAETDAPRAELAAYIDEYLDPEHRDNRATGCILPALAGEVARQAPEVRHAFTAAFEQYEAGLARLLPDQEGASRDDAALLLATGMAGALVLARAVDDPALSDRILAAARTFYKHQFTEQAQESRT